METCNGAADGRARSDLGLAQSAAAERDRARPHRHAAVAGEENPRNNAATRLPRIAILMPCRNGERYIAEALASVQRQGYPGFDCLVLDACSTDGTLALLARYPEVAVISEPDAGVHDAM